MQPIAGRTGYSFPVIGFEAFDDDFKPQPMSAEQKAECDRLIRQDTLEDARQNVVYAKTGERIANRLEPLAKATTWGTAGFGVGLLVAACTNHPLVAFGCGVGTFFSAVFGLAATHSQHRLREDAKELRAEADRWIKDAPPAG